MNVPSIEWFNEAETLMSQTHSSCPRCLSVIFSNEDEYHCPLCLATELENYNISSTTFIQNIDQIMDKASEEELLHILTEYSRSVYSCPECSCIEDDQYFCTSCEGQRVTEVDFIIRTLIESGKNQFAEKLTQLNEEI